MEVASTLARNAIEQLLSLHALSCMGRATGNLEHFAGAAEWLPRIESTLQAIRRDLEQQMTRVGQSVEDKK